MVPILACHLVGMVSSADPCRTAADLGSADTCYDSCLGIHHSSGSLMDSSYHQVEMVDASGTAEAAARIVACGGSETVGMAEAVVEATSDLVAGTHRKVFVVFEPCSPCSPCSWQAMSVAFENQAKIGAWSAWAIAWDSAGSLAVLHIAMQSDEMTVADDPSFLADSHPFLRYYGFFAETEDVAAQWYQDRSQAKVFAAGEWEAHEVASSSLRSTSTAQHAAG